MTEVSCSRCGSTVTGLEQPPLPGEIGEQVLSQTCASCWKQWLDVQVKLMNENRLTPANPEHDDQLIEHMKVFLSLTAAGEDQGG